MFEREALCLLSFVLETSLLLLALERKALRLLPFTLETSLLFRLLSLQLLLPCSFSCLLIEQFLLLLSHQIFASGERATQLVMQIDLNGILAVVLCFGRSLHLDRRIFFSFGD